ncbi:MAG: energy-coupled thiamine transporter ThiT [Erysipelotrichia bacterium]|nr:energy-coupled thiamine transporter ThiT [Erysipelotrichia bacterium]
MKRNVKDLVYVALYAALFVALDYVTNVLNLFRMPDGGSLSFATVALLLASYHLGVKKGLAVCALSVVLMFIIGSIKFYGIVSLLLDYIVAYCAYGLAGAFKNYKWFYPGIVITSLIRLASSTLAGMLVWETPFWGSLSYNASYIIPTMIVDLIFVPLLYNILKPTFEKK